MPSFIALLMKLGYILERSSLPLPTATTTSTTTARATTILNPFTVIKGMISAPMKRMSGKYNRAWYEKKSSIYYFRKTQVFSSLSAKLDYERSSSMVQ